MSNDHKYDFPRLAESNYNSWVGDMRAQLQRMGVWVIVSGEDKETDYTEEKDKRKWRVD
jgi:hypothetical protein